MKKLEPNKIDKVILINSPSRDYSIYARLPDERVFTPYGLGSVATYISKNTKYEIIVIDMEFGGLSLGDIIEKIDQNTVVGVNVQTPNYCLTMSLASEISKKAYKVVFGGPHVTLDPLSILRHVPDGICVLGDGEIPMTQILSGKDFDTIPGIVYKNNCTVPYIITNLDDMSWIDRKFLVNEPFNIVGMKSMGFLGSRGCYGKCAFCIAPAQYKLIQKCNVPKVRFRSMQDVVSEMYYAKSTYNIEFGQFIDDEMFHNCNRMKEFIFYINKMQKNEILKFGCMLRPDTIKKSVHNGLLEDLYSSGLRRISIGIESGHDRGRKLLSNIGGKINPKYEKQNVIDAIKYCNDLGIVTKGFFLLGLPGETKEEMLETENFIFELKKIGLNEVAVFPLKVYPHTALWDEAIKRGFTSEQLGHYSSPTITKFISKGKYLKDMTRDGITQNAQIAKLPPCEINAISQRIREQFNLK